MALKLRQGQLWQQGDQFIRIVKLDRLEVDYLTFKTPKAGEGKAQHTSKKDFCRLLKDAALIDENPSRSERAEAAKSKLG